MTTRQAIKFAVFQTCKYIGIFRLSRFLVRKKLLILCYHGFELTDESEFRPRLFMPRGVFSRRLEAIRRMSHPVLPLDEAVKRLYAGTLPDNAVCLTIDDGFHSVRACAAPLLEQHGFPATLYVTSYYVAKEAPIFRLVVQYMFWKTAVPHLGAMDEPWGPTEPVDLSAADKKDSSMWQIIEYGENQCDEAERQRISEVLGGYLHVDYTAIRDSRILTLLTPRELQQLDDSGIDVQLHTHRHRLPVDDEACVRDEVTENADFLAPIVKHPLAHFCYPSGEWDKQHWPWLANLGIETATTCDPCFNKHNTPALGLYRVVDGTDVSQIEFEAELSGVSELIRIITGRRKKLERFRRENVPTT